MAAVVPVGELEPTAAIAAGDVAAGAETAGVAVCGAPTSIEPGMAVPDTAATGTVALLVCVVVVGLAAADGWLGIGGAAIET